MPADAVAWALGAHGAVLSFSLVGLYRYSDRSSLFTKSLAGTDELLSRMRRYLATAIEDELTPIFDRAESEPQIVLPDVYTESPVRPVSSDAFREAIRRFVYSDADILIDYGRVRRARFGLVLLGAIIELVRIRHERLGVPLCFGSCTDCKPLLPQDTGVHGHLAVRADGFTNPNLLLVSGRSSAPS